MVSNNINCLFNSLKISKQKKCFMINIKLSNNLVKILCILLKDGFIRGYFFGWYQNKRVAFILLKDLKSKNKSLFDKVFFCFYKKYFLKKYLFNVSNGFCFFIISSQINFISSYNLLFNQYKIN